MTKLDTGLSGCSLELISDRVLRKYSSSPDYDSRLFKQAVKQRVFSESIYKNIDAPRIHRIDEDCFDMEYIPGHSFVEFFETASIGDVEFVKQTLFDYFDQLISTSRYIDPGSKILDKIDTLRPKTGYPKLLDYIQTIVIRYNLRVPHTFCHGDLTFSNIIFHPNRLFFIDFLDCYVDTFLSDLVKLKQDLYYLWGLKTQNIQSNRIEQIYRYIWTQLEERYSEYMDETFDILDVMNTLRLEPYLTSESHRVILDTIVKSTQLYALSDSANGGSVESIPKHATEVDVDASDVESFYGYGIDPRTELRLLR